jgi:uncharacterized protein YndB with AHSA1/START domain
MMLIIAGAAVVVVATILALAASKPDTLEVQRSVTIDASPERVFALIDNLHNWPQWAPQDREDSSTTRTYGGSESGVGATSAWDSKGSAGKGSMSITESTPPTEVTVVVDFVRPFTAHNTNVFRLEPAGSGTQVTWTWHGTNPYMGKVMSIFVSMDRMVGKHFEDGLANLKLAAEQR